MIELTEQIKPALLKNITITLNDKAVRSGKLTVFNFKQHFIRFTLENNSAVKDFELPYPFRIQEDTNTITFNYHITSFGSGKMLKQLKTLDSSSASKFYDGEVKISF